MDEVLGLLFAFVVIVGLFAGLIHVSGVASDIYHIQSKYSNQVGG